MTDLRPLVGATYDGLADLLAAAPAEVWDRASLCEDWQVRHVIAHVTMPVRLTPEQFGTEMAAAGGDFTVLSNTIAARDASLPAGDQLDALRSKVLHDWQPPGGGPTAAVSHATIHSLDITVAMDQPTAAPPQAVATVLDQLTATDGALFGVDLAGIRLEATDTDWNWGNGETLDATSGELVVLLGGRRLPDGRCLPRVQARP